MSILKVDEKQTPRQRILSIFSKIEAYISVLEERKKHILFEIQAISSTDRLTYNLNEIEKKIVILRFAVETLAIVLRKFEEGEIGTAMRLIDKIKENIKLIAIEFTFDLDEVKKEIMMTNEEEVERTLESIISGIDKE